VNSALVKTTELTKLLRRAVNEADELPLTETEATLYAAIHLALMAYEDEVLLGHPVAERHCMNCGVLLNQCSC
jgi:hypothetical protein